MTYADLKRRLPALAKGVPCPADHRPPGDRVEVYHRAGKGWRTRQVAGGHNINNPGEFVAKRSHASQQAIVHASPWLPVYRKEINGTWSFLRAPLVTGFGAKESGPAKKQRAVCPPC